MTLVGILLCIVSFLVVMSVPIAFLIYYALKNHYEFKALGMKIRCTPKEMSSKISKKDMETRLTKYAKNMASVFDVKESDILDHFAKTTSEFVQGFLDNAQRKAHGLGDANNDGKEDKVVGFTLSPVRTLISVMDLKNPDGTVLLSMYDEKGNIDLGKTAFMYETHNSVMEQFKGYSVTMAESFIEPTNKAMQAALRVDEAGLAKLLAQRKTYDQAFSALDV